MTVDADMDMDTATTTTTTLILATRIHMITMLITPTNTGRLVCLTVTTPALCTRIQIRIPLIPTITVSTTVLIVAIAVPLWRLHSRIPIHSPITIMSDKKVNPHIPTHMCTTMNIPTSHILIPALHLLVKSKLNMDRSLPQSGNENPILVARPFKLHLKTNNHTQHPQLKFHFRSRRL